MEEEIPDILCINCENMIQYEKLSAHSQVCFSYCPEVQKFDSSPEMCQINFRIVKLKSSLEAQLYFLSPNKNQNLLQSLLSMANQALKIHSYAAESVENLTSILSSIRKLCKSLPCKYTVYSERLRLLVSNKVYHILDVINTHSENKKKRLFASLHPVARRSLEDIRIFSDRKISQAESSENIFQLYEQRHSIGNRSPFRGTDQEDSQKLSQEMSNMFSKESLKKFFYSKCLIVKLSFSSRHPAQYIQINDLFEKVMNEKTPITEWEKFIKEEFSHPERWVNLEVIPNYEKFK